MSKAKQRITKTTDQKVNWVLGGGPESYKDGLWI